MTCYINLARISIHYGIPIRDYSRWICYHALLAVENCFWSCKWKLLELLGWIFISSWNERSKLYYFYTIISTSNSQGKTHINLEIGPFFIELERICMKMNHQNGNRVSSSSSLEHRCGKEWVDRFRSRRRTPKTTWNGVKMAWHIYTWAQHAIFTSSLTSASSI